MADGRQQNLLNLVGTISVVSRQNSGRIIEVPVEICLPLNYPQELPIIWIRPEMIFGAGSSSGNAGAGGVILRPTNNVDENGMVWGLDGLNDLRLIDLLEQLKETFGYQLPIVSALSKDEEQQEYLGGVIRESSNVSYSVQDINSLGSLGDGRALLRKKVLQELEGRLKCFDAEIDKICKSISDFEEGDSILKRERMTLNNEINLILKEINCVEGKRVEIETFIATNSAGYSSGSSYSSAGISTGNGSSTGNTISNAGSLSDQRSATVPSDPASSQLLELLSNESALMDTLYALIKVTMTPANGQDRLPLNSALRGIRELSRKHFLTKAHIKKVINA